MKKLLAIILTLALLCSFTACSEKISDALSGGEVDEETGSTIHYIGDEEGKDILRDMDNPLDPAEVYATIEHDNRFLYGIYQIQEGTADRKSFWKNTPHMELEYWCYSELEKCEMTAFPYEITAGPCSDLTYQTDSSQEWATVSFAVSEKGTANVLCTMEVEGNTVTFTPVDYYKEVYDEEFTQKLGAEYVLGEDSITYEFVLEGPKLTLSNEYGSYTLYANVFTKYFSIGFGGYPSVGSPILDGLDTYIISGGTDSVYYTVDGEQIFETSAAKVYDDGRITFYWVEKLEDGTKVEHLHHLVYICCGSNACILSDGEKVYYYQDNYRTQSMAQITIGMTEEEIVQVQQMPDSQLEEIVEKKENLLGDLAAAFREAGLNVAINETTGEIALDNTFLFAVNEYELSEEGKAFLAKFLQVYAGVVFNEKYADFISRIVVEGHTDTSGEHAYNLELSQKRADSVLNYCLSDEIGIDAAYAQTLVQMLSAKGYSYDYPVYNENGEVDMDASRRVSFRFIVKVG